MKLMYAIARGIKKISFPAMLNSTIAKSSKINAGSQIVDVSMGKYSYIGYSCSISFTSIGNFCSIASGCIIGGASHPIDWVSTSPVFHNGKNCMRLNFSKHDFHPCKKTIIGNDVWIGSNCLIKSGIVIGNGAIIGMGSVVTKNVGPYEIWAGNPAKLIRKRFNDEQIIKLQNSKWWDSQDATIRKLAEVITDVDTFLLEIEK